MTPSEEHQGKTSSISLGSQFTPVGRTESEGADPTTSFLTAAMAIYTLRAGITAAAGTRLALS